MEQLQDLNENEQMIAREENVDGRTGNTVTLTQKERVEVNVNVNHDETMNNESVIDCKIEMPELSVPTINY